LTALQLPVSSTFSLKKKFSVENGIQAPQFSKNWIN
ncbi:unnamed protein product, partial [Oikopleura dioica]